MSCNASIRLDTQQIEEMNTLGFKNPSQYVKYKLGSISAEEAMQQIEGLGSIQQNYSESKPNAPQNIEDAIRLRKAESENERLRHELNALKSNSSESLGQLDTIANERVNQILKDREHVQLKHDKEILLLEAKQKDTEIENLKADLKGTNAKIKNIELIKQFAPVVQPVLAGLGRGIAAMQGGGGISALLSGFDQIGDAQESKLSNEDESSLELGRNIQSMFTENELQQVLFTVAIMSKDKNLIKIIPQFINKLSEKSDLRNTTSDEIINNKKEDPQVIDDIEEIFE